MSEALLKQILNEITGIKSDMAEMKADITDMKAEINDMKSDITGIKTELQETNIRLTRIEKKQDGIFEQTGKLSEYHAETNVRFDQLQSDIEFTYQKTAIHDLKFNRIENLPPQ